MGNLLATIEASVQRPGGTCSVGNLLRDLPPADAADLRAAIERANIPASAIVRGLAAAGHRVADQAVTRHRRAECQCPRS